MNVMSWLRIAKQKRPLGVELHAVFSKVALCVFGSDEYRRYQQRDARYTLRRQTFNEEDYKL